MAKKKRSNARTALPPAPSTLDTLFEQVELPPSSSPALQESVVSGPASLASKAPVVSGPASLAPKPASLASKAPVVSGPASLAPKPASLAPKEPVVSGPASVAPKPASLAPKEAPVLTLSKVNKIFFGEVETQVLYDIDLEVMPGEFVAIVGASGSGKSTLLNLMGLLDTPTSGKIVLGGRDAAQLSEDERAIMRRDYLGFIFQFHYLLPEYNVLENALMPCRLRGHEAEIAGRPRMLDLLDLIGLKDRIHHRPSQLSGGQQQRVAILRALANDPVLVLADEPTGNLDSKSGEIVFSLMRELNRSTKKAFLLVTHDPAFADRADRLIRLVDGRIVEDTRR